MFRINIVVFEISSQEARLLASSGRVCLALLCVVKNASEAEREAKQELDCVKQELVQLQGQLQQ